MTTKLFFAIVSIVFLFIAVQPAEAQGLPTDVGYDGTYIYVNQDVQTLTVYKDGENVFHAICGTGSIFVDPKKGDQTTPNSTPGKPFVICEKDPGYVNRDGVPMPYALRLIPEKGYFIHGNDNFVVYEEKGIPQSGGCVRLSTTNAKTVYDMVKNGDKVVIVGNPVRYVESLGVWDLFTKESDLHKVRFYVASPGYDQNHVAKAREAWLKGRLLVERPRGTKVRSRCFVRFPFMPETSRMPLSQFEQVILTHDEKARGLRLTLGDGVELQD